MARIDWAVLCELAYFDRYSRLCLIGVRTRLTVPRLPFAVDQLVVVARVAGLAPVEKMDVAVAIVSPRGIWTTPTNDAGLAIISEDDYILATMRGIPLADEGIYSFRLLISDQPPVALDIPILTGQSVVQSHVH